MSVKPTSAGNPENKEKDPSKAGTGYTGTADQSPEQRQHKEQNSRLELRTPTKLKRAAQVDAPEIR